ncbi:DUF1737 domain-containing protein [Pseudomonas aeruginosa]|uniref:DUF1737 domain-containing protein n=1 Tax=Pseudomonas aeruginosa TaxID=287 RepID=UPI001A1E2F90|nr:DUF1737 domain-containing protein [Pseudomonas aeruginosa]EKG0328519.1 DUF1737 domain-containing protein [Pseudomonas aeruginosa]MBI8682459.1 DUF1737 domain-containing protein [Pseudomonas aeruginosa]MCV4257208.1 DUF1737 domain-containing protein [Pseudomonas aeruginosa]WCV21601.1 DUF1737 domain-containing protein [Pseudomonas aeruginosa]HCF3423646.1 DUF1737 domain-containing protein [Pseudomonas aeruginosa]
MAYTAYRVLKAPIDQIERFMTEAIADGWQPLGAPILFYPDDKAVYQALVKGTPDGSGTGPVTIVVDDITDASAIGKSLLTAVNDGDGRAAIGAGTSNLQLGTTATTAKAGDYAPAWGDVTGKPAVIAAGTDAATARGAIGAGTSSLAIGTTATTAAAGDHNHAITADAASGLAAASSVQDAFVAVSARIKALESAAP